MTIQQHKQLVRRLHVITVILGASLALIAYLVVLNIRTTGVDARGRCTGLCRSQNYPPSCGLSYNYSAAPYYVTGQFFSGANVTGLVYRDGTSTGSFPINATKYSTNDYYFYNAEVPSNLYTASGTYTVKVKDSNNKIVDCGGFFTI